MNILQDTFKVHFENLMTLSMSNDMITTEVKLQLVILIQNTIIVIVSILGVDNTVTVIILLAVMQTITIIIRII